jgi:hypothetical protein
MISGDVQGTFGLVKQASSTTNVNTYSLKDISWFVFGSNGQVIHTITGSGTYRFSAVGTGFEKHQLTLTINIDGQGPVRLDSGQVIGCPQFPAISISVRRGTRCFDIWMDIIATP